MRLKHRSAERIEQALRCSGSLCHHFMGIDHRSLQQIIAADTHMVALLGTSHAQIADRLARLTRRGQAGLGDPVLLGGRYELCVTDFRGTVTCPWGDAGAWPKSHIVLTDRHTAVSLQWTHLCLHLIAQHGFYQGIGSPYRLDPRTLQFLLTDLAPCS